MVPPIAKRVSWIDIAKGISIIAMVAGHSSIPLGLSRWIWSFHMPLFFLVSGIFTFKEDSFIQLLKRRIRQLLIPYLFFSTIVFCGYIGTEYHRQHEIYMGWEGYALWFVPVLMMSELMLYPIINRLKIASQKLVLFVALILLMTVLSHSISASNVHLPYKIDCIFACSIFVLSGWIVNLFYRQIIFDAIPVLLCFMLSIGISALLPKLDLAANYLGYGLPNVINAFVGIYAIFGISYFFDKLEQTGIVKHFLLWCGRNTIFIMAFSQLYNYWLLKLFNELHVSHTIGIALRYILLFVLIYFSSLILIKYFPLFVGKKKTHQI